ncbi:phage tail protein [Antarctobacter heliothermus]|uniref:Microcystin-dependent protein n=1 Tax=Antarctobacter heliothermus TaxID=74033 RepID=A0A239HXB7_9RHOB|nr:tail fiber protein [Antarctobacter heliothermus]SNS85363.1 Microcystin-dependent protein [Antarctobacter heliothermus]
MSEPYVAQITMFAGNFAPRGWAFCDGQLLAVSQNDALFSLLGTIYGGDGRTTFGLPDLRGRAAMHAGSGPGLSTYRIGQKGGQERVTLTTNQMPSHNHGVTMRAESRGGNLTDPGGNMLAAGSSIFRTNTPADDVGMDAAMIRQNNVGGSQSHNNLPPFLAVNYIIALVGIYPSRN